MSINVAKNKAVYHNPKRQRGICYHTAETESLTHVSGCEIAKLNPSLTCRVVIVGKSQFQNWRFGFVKPKKPAKTAGHWP